jgi:hypothetical protein
MERGQFDRIGCQTGKITFLLSKRLRVCGWWSLNPSVVGSKPANGGARSVVLLSQFLPARQVRFGSPALWSAFHYVTQPVEHGSDGGAVAK